jgi:TolA-binding protein
MEQPPRLIDETDNELEVELLREARAYRAPRQTHAHVLAALGIAGSTAALAKSSAAAITTWSLKGWVAASVLVGGAAMGVTTLVAQPPDPVGDSAPVVQPAAQLAQQRPPPQPQPAAVTEPAKDQATVAPDPPEPASRPSGGKTTPARASLSEELAALDAARAALQSGDGAGALRRLNEHARRFPRGRLRLEAEVLWIEALARTGNRTAAARRARRFLDRHPNSVLAPRLRRYAGD